MTVPCVDTDIKPSSDDEGDCTSEVKFVRVSDLYSNYLKRWNPYKSPKSRREYARCLERQYLVLFDMVVQTRKHVFI